MINKGYFGEGKNIEFKKEIPGRNERFLKDIIAFSNCTGGKVILGIEDETHEVCGIGDINVSKLADSISNMISDACMPLIETDIFIKTVEEKTVLVIDVAPGKLRPYYIKSMGMEASTYIRINGTSRPADLRKIKELEMEGQRISYDSLQCIGLEYNEPDALSLCKKLYKFASDSCKTEEERSKLKEITIEKLEDFGLLCKVGRDLYPTNGYMLMTKPIFKYIKIQCALFKGTTRTVFIDKREFDGPIYEQLENAYQFVLRHINLSAEIDGLYRREFYELPIDAIREMIANAVVHRSYVDDSCIQVSVFDDRVEVMSPGMLYGGLDMESAKLGKSRCRNTAISEVFHYMGIIEHWGTGIPKIIEKCKKYELKEPVFEEFGDGIKVTMFRNKAETGSKTEQTGSKMYETGSGMPQTGPVTYETGSELLNAGSMVRETVSEYIIKNNKFGIYKDILNNSSISKKYIDCMELLFVKYSFNISFKQSDVMTVLGCSKATAVRIMKAMRETGIIEKVIGSGLGNYKFIDSKAND